MKIEPYVTNLDENSFLLYEYFLSHYSHDSIHAYKRAFHRISEWTDGKHINDLNYEDFKKVTENSNEFVFRQIFRFLFGFNCLQNSDGFEVEFENPEIIRKGIKNNKHKSIQEYDASIKLSDLIRLIEWTESIDDTNFDESRISFCFHMLFYEGISVSELKSLDAKLFKDNYIETSIDTTPLIIPERFIPFILAQKEKRNSKFSQLNVYIKTLGEKVNIANLEPIMLKQAHDQHTMRCSECGNCYLTTYDNWVSVHGYLICNDCFDTISSSEDVKKKSRRIRIAPIDVGSDIDGEYFIANDINENDLLGYDPYNIQEVMSQKIAIERLVRNSKQIQILKEIYGNKCQLCGQLLLGTKGNFISEGHHIRQFNKKHLGKDNFKNIIILCPNHHAQFDRLYFAIEPITHIVHCLNDDDQYNQKMLFMSRNHELDETELEYVWKEFCKLKESV